MDFLKARHWLAGALCLAGGMLQAQGVGDLHPVKMRQCLADKLSPAYQILAEDGQFSIVNVPQDKLGELSLLADKAACDRFVNLIAQTQPGHRLEAAEAKRLLSAKKPRRTPLAATEYQITHQEAVNKALALVQPQNIHDTLSHLVAFQNRSASLDLGVKTAEWLKEHYDAMAVEYGRTDVESYFVQTRWFRQPSLVTVLGKDKPGPGIVIGAHMDTLGYSIYDRMPGAGDDGSGSSSVMEVARVLMESKFEPQRPVYIIWYAAEEQGLVGSQSVVNKFLKEKTAVNAVIQFDMTGFRNDQDDSSMWLYRDYTDAALTDFDADLIKTYVQVPVKYSECGYGCSDHASWTAEGIPATFPCETDFPHHNPVIHTANDTMDRLNLDHMSNFTRLGVAFAIELAS